MGNKLEQIRERIAKRRKELGLSYQDLSDRTGMSKSTLQRYETGDIRNVSLDKLEPLAEALQTTPAYLMGWEGPESEPLDTEPNPTTDTESKIENLSKKYNIDTLAAHHDDYEWTDEELDEVENFIKFVQSKKK